MPLTEKGFHRQTYDEILLNMIEQAKILFGEDIDTSETSIFGKILRLYCNDTAQNQELAEQVYLSRFPSTANGVGLDRLCPIAGISRNPATYARHTIQILGTAGAVVAGGFLVSDGETVFHTLMDYTIGEDGTVTAIVECNDSGTVGNLGVGDITTVVNPDANVTGIIHVGIEEYAVNVESDYDLRKRFTQALSGSGSGTLDAISGAILRVSGVESVVIEENETDAEVDGMPPHSFRCYVLAPSSAQQDIADAIFEKKPCGITTAGDVETVVMDISGNAKIIRFSWTAEKSIFVKCNVSKNSKFGDASIKQIKENIVTKLAGYANGQSVTATSLYGAVYVEGVEDVTSLTISEDGVTYGISAIHLSKHEVARAVEGDIEVVVNE
jgi:uncharacterized phage protein gp47/JayE